MLRRLVLTIFFSIWLMLLSAVPVAANDETDIDVLMFYGNGCPHCAQAELLLEQMKKEYPQLKTYLFEVYSHRENIDLMVQYADAYNIETGAVPTLFIGQQAIVGDNSKKIRAAIEECAIDGCKSALEAIGPELAVIIRQSIATTNENAEKNPPSAAPLSDGSTETITDTNFKPEIKSEQMTTPSALTLPAVIGGAAVDAINPCEFAVLIILITTVLASGGRHRALMAGLAFTASVFISYLLMGLGLYSAIAAAGLNQTFYITVSILAILIGLFNLKDWLWYGKWFVMEVPISWRPRLQKIIRGVTSVPGAFLVGFAVSLFLLPCTSGPYVVILGLLAKTTTRSSAIGWLLLYNTIFILPMILITLAITLGITSVQKAEAWRQSKLRFLHLVAGLIILGLGISMLSSALLGYP
jgi:cytochrome c biogenesis protein CcdA/glutaredoxin